MSPPEVPAAMSVDPDLAHAQKGSPSRALGELERQMERGSLFTHATLQLLSDRLMGLEHTIGELLEALQGPQPAEPDAEGDTVVADEVDASDGPPAPSDTITLNWPSLSLRRDGDQDAGPPVDCAERMHICHAVCCKLNFALAPKEVESGVVKWDLGRPYFIRQDANGYCTHNDPDSRSCGVYDDRPQVCRTYSCVNDARIWSDFDNMVLNQEWIDEHLQKPSRILMPDPTIRMDRASERHDR